MVEPESCSEIVSWGRWVDLSIRGSQTDRSRRYRDKNIGISLRSRRAATGLRWISSSRTYSGRFLQGGLRICPNHGPEYRSLPQERLALPKPWQRLHPLAIS